MRALGIACLLFAAGAARAQVMLDQEQRLIEIHSLLIALQPGNAPGAYAPGALPGCSAISSEWISMSRCSWSSMVCARAALAAKARGMKAVPHLLIAGAPGPGR